MSHLFHVAAPASCRCGPALADLKATLIDCSPDWITITNRSACGLGPFTRMALRR